MVNSEKRTLLITSNPADEAGIRARLMDKWRNDQFILRCAYCVADAIAIMDEWKPETVLITYGDNHLDRRAFVEYASRQDPPIEVLQVALLANDTLVVYDRRNITADHVEDWLAMPEYIDPVDRQE